MHVVLKVTYEENAQQSNVIDAMHEDTKKESATQIWKDEIKEEIETKGRCQEEEFKEIPINKGKICINQGTYIKDNGETNNITEKILQLSSLMMR